MFRKIFKKYVRYKLVFFEVFCKLFVLDYLYFVLVLKNQNFWEQIWKFEFQRGFTYFDFF